MVSNKSAKAAAPKPRRRPSSSPGCAGPTARVTRLIVGIGASAGGLEAFKGSFAKMPPDSDMTFVLVQHLNPDRKSLLPELIARETAMPVREIENGMEFAPDSVFVMPPNATLTLQEGRFRLERPAPPRSRRYPIDAFFTSLGEGHGEHAIGIMLAGSDGTAGVRALKAAGGLTLAQAGFDHLALSGMPYSATATGLVNDVLQVADMPDRLIESDRHLASVAGLKDRDGARVDTARAGIRWRCEGPAVSVSAKAALALGMAFHELATNAAKYGAFSVSGGRIEVTWRQQAVDSEDRIWVAWIESGGPAVKERGRRGFGTRLISDGLAHELDGDVTLAFDPAGIRCTTDFPLEGFSPAKA